jgi:hypothetical protein
MGGERPVSRRLPARNDDGARVGNRRRREERRRKHDRWCDRVLPIESVA